MSNEMLKLKFYKVHFAIAWIFEVLNEIEISVKLES